jgi:2-phosphoglycerate kinase
MTRDKTPHIVISDADPGLPYSKGLMASQVMVTGLPPYRAYEVAETIESRLLDQGRSSITTAELAAFVIEIIRELAGDRYAINFGRWQDVERLDVPLVILIGGATGVGKSTIAREVATRFRISVVASDHIREVMRSMLSAVLMPTLHTSSFQADTALSGPPTQKADAIIVGFREQTQAVAVGVNALIERAAVEGTSLIIEGPHVVPGFIDTESHGARILAVPFVLTVEEEERHLSHFAAREDALGWRPAERYRRGIDNIRKIQQYTKDQAATHGVPVIPNHSFDQSIAAVIDLVMQRATERATELRLRKEDKERIG